MTLSPEQAEIIALDTALDSQKLCVVRMRRREEQAKAERSMAEWDLENMQAKLQYMREALLRRGCV